MEANNFFIQSEVKFAGNSGDFNEQPIFTLLKNNTLTGGEFISVYRIRTNRNEAASGILGVTHGSTGGLYSVSGSRPLYPQSLTANNNSTTANSQYYNISLNITDKSRLDLVIKDNNLFFGDISVTGLTGLSNFNYLSNGTRPVSDSLPTDGTTGKSSVLCYTYNREELSSSLTSVADRSGNSLNADIKGSASGNGTSATITGWTYSPIEGGFRFDGRSWLESQTSNLFNPVSTSLSSFTVLLFAKLCNTGDTSIFSIGSSATELLSLKEESTILRVKIGNNSYTAGPIDIGKWYHYGITMNCSTSSESGSWLYINGTSAASSAITTIPSFNNDSRLIIGKHIDLSLSSMTGVVGLTRIFNRALSSQEIAMNYFSTIPSQIVLNKIEIAKPS